MNPETEHKYKKYIAFNPFSQSSQSAGRHLLEWYMNLISSK